MLISPRSVFKLIVYTEACITSRSVVIKALLRQSLLLSSGCLFYRNLKDFVIIGKTWAMFCLIVDKDVLNTHP